MVIPACKKGIKAYLFANVFSSDKKEKRDINNIENFF
jgi:hypothetical protein